MLQVMERRLAAILSIDVVGYSRLMGADEGGTLAALRSCREQLIEPKVAQHHGRTIKLMGDGALMEFTSIVDAVLFAVDVQCAMRERNSNVPEDRRLVFRIGINLGDVIAEGADIYGDGVNIAARLEAIAEPGGICVSSAVCNQVRDKLALDFEDKGESKVKNIDRPLHVFRLVLNGKADALATPVPTSRPTAVRRWRIVTITAALAAVVSVAGVVWWRTSSPRLERASVEHMAYPLPDRPSIAVLPFNNLTGDPKQAHAADGMTETLITTLARIPDLFVIARNSSSVYKGKAVKVQNVAEELGVRYVLEGSVQQADGKVRVIVQLIDALRGQHLWAETYDRSIEDLFKLQDEIALKTTVALQIKLTTGEEARILSRETNNVQAWILYQQAESAIFRFDREGMRDARALAKKALTVDPGFAAAMIAIGYTHLVDARSHFTASPEDSLAKAIAYANKARAIAPEAPNLYNLLQEIDLYQGNFDKAMAEGERSIELSPNSAISMQSTAMTAERAGHFDRAIELAERAIRHSPHHRSVGLILLSRSLWFKGRYAEAIKAAQEGLKHSESPRVAAFHLLNLAAAYAETGELNKARTAAKDVSQKIPGFRLAYLKTVTVYKNDADWQRLASALRTAGLPE